MEMPASQRGGGALLWGAGQLRALALSTNPSKHRNGNACKPGGGGALSWGAGQLRALALSTNPSKHRNGNACKPGGGGGSIMGSWTAQSPRSEYEPPHNIGIEMPASLRIQAISRKKKVSTSMFRRNSPHVGVQKRSFLRIGFEFSMRRVSRWIFLNPRRRYSHSEARP